MKTLQEIQRENRILILRNIHGDKIDNLLGGKYGISPAVMNYEIDHYNKAKLGLDSVLLAIDSKLGLINRIMLAGQELTIPFFDSYGHTQCIDWDLPKETLEEQSEKTQRIINELLELTSNNN